MIPDDLERRVLAPDVLEFKLEGGGGLEDVPAEDVGVFIVELVRLVARAAGHAINRPVKDTGRYEALVKAASQVRLKAVESGSVRVALAPSRSEQFLMGDNLGLDAQDVSQRAMVIAREAIEGGGSRYPDVARVWVELADRVGLGKRYERIVIEEPGRPPVALDVPLPPSISISISRPSGIVAVAFSTPTTAGSSNSRATIAACDSMPPTSVTRPPAMAKMGTQDGFEAWHTTTSPAPTTG